MRGKVAQIGVSEKGYLTVEFTVHSQPGHSSTPPPKTAIGILARALDRLESHPMPTHLRRLRPVYAGIGIAAPMYLQVAFANIWLFGPLLKRWLVPLPEMNASIRTTTALTIIHGGVEDNTIPAEAKAIEEMVAHSIDYLLQTSEWGTMNRTVLRAESLAWAVRALPGHPRAPVWEKQRKALGDDNWGNWQIEDATIYHGVWLYALMGYADALGRLDELFKTPEMYYYAALLSPS